MAKQNVNIGVSANDGTGDTLRDGAIKLNNVINELYDYLGDQTNLQISVGSPSTCLLYTSPSPRDRTRSRMPSSA